MPAEDLSNLVFDVLDYQGVRVTCSREQWHDKISLRHVELETRKDEVTRAIRDPAIVLQDRDFPARRHFLRLAGDRLYIVVVVEYPYVEPPVVGRFITAFLRSRIRSDDRVIYSNGPR